MVSCLRGFSWTYLELKEEIIQMLRLVIAPFAVFLFLPLFFNVPKTYAVGLGLADANYDLTLNFADPIYDATGTMTISGGLVTSFHVDTNASLGYFDCGTALCAPGAGDPDTVFFNPSPSNTFLIQDDNGNNPTYRFLSLAPNHGLNLNTVGGAIITSGTWAASLSSTPVPEPSSAILTILGLLALGVFGRLRVIGVS